MRYPLNGLVLCAAITAVATTTAMGQTTIPLANRLNAPAISIPGAQSAWVKGYSSSARLIAGTIDASRPDRQLLSGVQLRLDEGWKTYWSNPGDDGGVRPTFDWSASSNLKSARMMYPTPSRIVGKTGMSIGYLHGVVFPVEIEAIDPTKPIDLVLALEYGVCREICVPAEAKLQLTLTPQLTSLPPDLANAVAQLPRHTRLPTDPSLKSASATLAGPKPNLTFDIATGTFGANVDVFIEAPDGVYLPMTAKAGEPRADVQRFVVDLKGIEEAPQLVGKTLRLLIAGKDSGVATEWTVPKAAGR